MVGLLFVPVGSKEDGDDHHQRAGQHRDDDRQGDPGPFRGGYGGHGAGAVDHAARRLRGRDRAGRRGRSPRGRRIERKAVRLIRRGAHHRRDAAALVIRRRGEARLFRGLALRQHDLAQRRVQAADDRFQLGADQPDAGDAALAIFFEHPVDQHHQGFGERRAQPQQIGGGLGQDRRHDRRRAGFLKRHAPGQHLVQHHAERPDVGAFVQFQAVARLGAEVGVRPDHRAGLGQAGAVAQVRHAEIGQARGAIFGQQHVIRLDVAVNDVQSVGAGQGIGQVQRDIQHRFERQPALIVEQIAQGTAADKFHNQVMFGGIFKSVQQRDNIGMVQLAQGFSLAPETIHQIWIAFDDILVQQFDRDGLVRVYVGPAIHVAHATPPDQRVDLITSGNQCILAHRQIPVQVIRCEDLACGRSRSAAHHAV